jgi:hypothetical protein
MGYVALSLFAMENVLAAQVTAKLPKGRPLFGWPPAKPSAKIISLVRGAFESFSL